MATPIADSPPTGSMLAQRVAQPVSFPVGSTWIEQINFLHGRNKHIVGSVSRIAKTAGAATASYLRYYRSPGAQLALVCVVPWNGTAETASLTVSLALGGASAIGHTSLDGATVIPCTSAYVRAPAEEWALIDVSGLTVGTAYDLVVTSTGSGAGSQGVEHISMIEVMRDMLDPGANPSTDPGVNAVFPAPGNDIYAGTASTTADIGSGTERIIGQLNSIKTSVRSYPLNICTVEDTTLCWSTASAAYAALTGLALGRWYCIPRRWFTTATTNNVNVRVRYLAASGGSLRVITTPVGGASTNNDTALGASAAWATATGTATIDASGTDGEAYIELNAKATAGTVYIGAVSLIDNET